MTRNRPRVPSATRTRHSFGLSSVLARSLALSFMAFALGGCEAKLPSTFEPVIGVPGGGGGGGGTGLTANDVAGTWNVSYATTATTCEGSLPPFDVEAAMTITGTGSSVTLDVLFPDAPVPIRGTLALPGGDFTGTTGPVDIGSGFFATEAWDATFSLSTTDDVVFSGTSEVDVEDDGGAFVCARDFTITGIRIF